MKSIEILGIYSGSASKRYDPTIVFLSWILLQSIHRIGFQNIETPRGILLKQIESGEAAAVAISLSPALDFRSSNKLHNDIE